MTGKSESRAVVEHEDLQKVQSNGEGSKSTATKTPNGVGGEWQRAIRSHCLKRTLFREP